MLLLFSPHLLPAGLILPEDVDNLGGQAHLCHSHEVSGLMCHLSSLCYPRKEEAGGGKEGEQGGGTQPWKTLFKAEGSQGGFRPDPSSREATPHLHFPATQPISLMESGTPYY